MSTPYTKNTSILIWFGDIYWKFNFCHLYLPTESTKNNKKSIIISPMLTFQCLSFCPLRVNIFHQNPLLIRPTRAPFSESDPD